MNVAYKELKLKLGNENSVKMITISDYSTYANKD